jgi:predicted aspartyl protease
MESSHVKNSGQKHRPTLHRRAPICVRILGLASSLLFASCAVRTSEISTSLERQLKKRSISSEQFGITFTPTGQRMQLFTAHLDREPVSVPMVRGLVGLPAVDVTLNDAKPLRMILDTGAQMSVVEAKRADHGKAQVFASEKRPFRVVGVGGEELAWLARFDKVSIGSLRLRQFIAVLRRSKTSVRFAGVPLAGLEVNLLGSPTFSGFNHVTLDYPAKAVVFSATGDFQPRPTARRVPMVVRDGLFYIPLQIGKHSVAAMVDTGAKDEIFLNRQLVNKWGMGSLAEKGSNYRAAGIGGETSGKAFRLALAFVGDEPVRDVTIDTADGLWTARIGTDLLSRWRVTFDFKRGAMWLE